MGLTSDQALMVYYHKFCATISLPYFSSRRDCRSKVSWLSWCLSSSFSSLQSTLPCQRDCSLGVRAPCRDQMTSPRSMSCVGVFLKNETPLSICREQLVVLTIAWISRFGDFQSTSLFNNSIELNLVLPLEALPGHKMLAS